MITISKDMIDNIFDFADNQHIAWKMLYELVYSNFNEIKKLDDYPRVNELTNNYIWMKFMRLDEKYHPEVISGGLWMNLGFGTDESLSDWKIKPCGYTLCDN